MVDWLGEALPVDRAVRGVSGPRPGRGGPADRAAEHEQRAGGADGWDDGHAVDGGRG